MRNALLASAAIFALSACLSGSDDSGTDPLPPGSSFAVLAIDGEAAPDGTTFELGPDDAIAGQAPCNRFMAQLSRTDAGISISPGASTRMACLNEARSAAETRFLAALPEITAASPGPEAGQVALTDTGGATRLLLGPLAAE